MPRLQFWYEFASNYSYLTAMRIEQASVTHGVEIVWKPFLLGPIFRAQGWNTSPFNIYSAKGAYMRREMQRLADERGLAFVMPEPFPANSLLAARIARLGEGSPWIAPFSKDVFRAEFSEGKDISDVSVLRAILSELGLDAAGTLEMAASQSNKDALRRRVDEASELGIFGAPSFVAEDGELFWGDDRLNQALKWATRTS